MNPARIAADPAAGLAALARRRAAAGCTLSHARLPGGAGVIQGLFGS